MDTGLNFDRCQFDGWHGYMSHDEFVTNGVTYQDRSSMQVVRHKLETGRRLERPLWAVNDSIMRELLLAFMEDRLKLHTQGTHAERREAIRLAGLAQLPSLNATIDRLQIERLHVIKTSARHERIKELERQIENYDTQIRTSGMAIVAGVAHLYFRAGYASTEVAKALGIKPPMVRQLIWRMGRVWRRKFNPDGTLKPVAPAQLPIDCVRAMEMHKSGMPWKEIGRLLGYPRSPDNVRLECIRAGLFTTKLKPNTRRRVARAARVAAGLCCVFSCKNRARLGFTTCETCALYFSKLSRKYALRRKRARLRAARPSRTSRAAVAARCKQNEPKLPNAHLKT
jgi:hypothetical protein